MQSGLDVVEGGNTIPPVVFFISMTIVIVSRAVHGHAGAAVTFEWIYPETQQIEIAATGKAGAAKLMAEKPVYVSFGWRL